MKFLTPTKTIAMVSLNELDVTSGTTLEEMTRPLKERSPLVILESSHILFNSSQIGEVVMLARAYHTRWGNDFSGIRLVNSSDYMRQVLQTMRLENMLKIFSTLEEAYQDTLRASTGHSAQQTA